MLSILKVKTAPFSSSVPVCKSPLTGFFSRLPADTFLLLLAIVIGGGAGLGVLLFRYLIALIEHLLLEELMDKIAVWGSWTLAVVPLCGGIIVSIIRLIFREFSPPISALIAAVKMGNPMVASRAIAKTVAAAVSLGTGASLGPEGPSVEIGANLAIGVGQALHMSRERQQLLLGAGAAAGLAAGFNAPIAGVFFALEVVLGTILETSAASVVLLSAVVSALITQVGLGHQPAFGLPVYEVRSPLELPLYLGLGLCACVVAIAYSYLLHWLPKLVAGEIPGFYWLAKIPPYILPPLGGLCVGLVALKLPQIWGIGYETVEAILYDVEIPLVLLLALLLTKLVLSPFCLASGLVGGIFAPAMFLGASLGAAYGKILPMVFPVFAHSIAAPPAYAMVGMAAVLAGSVNAPLTAILLLFEMTHDYRIILPLMAAVGLSVWLANLLRQLLQLPSHLPLPRETGGENNSEVVALALRNNEILNSFPVEKAMEVDFLVLPADLSLLEAGKIMVEKQCHSAFVLDSQRRFVGIVTLQDINRGIATAQEKTAPPLSPQETLVAEVCTTEIVYAYPDEPLGEALERMATRGLRQLPVVERQNPNQLLGLLKQDNINLVYDLALTRAKLAPFFPENTDGHHPPS